MPAYAIRMCNAAAAWLHDADTLGQSMRSLEVQSDSEMLLRILAFEVLLKCAARLCGKTLRELRSASHGYVHLWRDLPPDAQREILQYAHERIPGQVKESELDRLLIAYEYAFNKARYFYEQYEDYTLEQQHELGQFWEELGAPEDEADVAYHPEELLCLTAGLRGFVVARLQ